MLDGELYLTLDDAENNFTKQIVSAHGFNSRDLRVLWELLPSGWTLAPHSDHGNEQKTCLYGATQVFKYIYGAFNILLIKSVYVQTAMTTTLRAPKSTCSSSSAELPLGVYKSTTSSHVMAVGLVILLVLTLLTDLSWIWWMLLAIVLLIGDVWNFCLVVRYAFFFSVLICVIYCSLSLSLSLSLLHV